MKNLKIGFLCSITIVLCVLLFEYVSLKIIEKRNPYYNGRLTFNRELSAYHLFKNVAHHEYEVVDGQNNLVKIKADSNGFLYCPEVKDPDRNIEKTIFLCGGSAAMGSGQVTFYNLNVAAFFDRL